MNNNNKYGTYPKWEGYKNDYDGKLVRVPVTDPLPMPDRIDVVLLKNDRTRLGTILTLKVNGPSVISLYNGDEEIYKQRFSANFDAGIRRWIIIEGMLSKVHWEREESTSPFGKDFGYHVEVTFKYNAGTDETDAGKTMEFKRVVDYAHPSYHNLLYDSVLRLFRTNAINPYRKAGFVSYFKPLLGLGPIPVRFGRTTSVELIYNVNPLVDSNEKRYKAIITPNVVYLSRNMDITLDDLNTHGQGPIARIVSYEGDFDVLLVRISQLNVLQKETKYDGQDGAPINLEIIIRLYDGNKMYGQYYVRKIKNHCYGNMFGFPEVLNMNIKSVIPCFDKALNAVYK